MSQAEELLNSVSEEVPMHTHPVPDTDTYFVIDPITRKIENTNRKKNVIMQYDHNSERFTFELPRYIDGHDMLECTSVTVNVDNIEIVESDGIEEVKSRVNPDAPDITDLRVHPDDSEKVICSWLISRNSTQLAGILSFHIEFKCVDSNGNVVYEWGSDNFDEIEVRARKKNGEAAVAENSDLLEQWRTRIFGAGDSVVANIAAEGEAQVAAVKAESESLRADVSSKGDAIVCEAIGESIILADSSNDYIRGLKLFGKSKQNGVPTPEAPVDPIIINNPTVNVCGKNLLDVARIFTFTQYTDMDVYIPAGTYVLACDSIVTEYGVGPTIGFSDNNVWVELKNSGLQKTITLTKAETRLLFYSAGADYNWSEGKLATINGLMLIIEGGDYEPHKPIQSLTINRTLSGIPVTSGGNYTDSDGQQWICDEIDLERGVYVQRCFKTSDFKANNEQDGFIQYRASFAATPIIPESMGLLNVTDRWSTAVFDGTTHCLINTSGTAVYVYMPSDYDINIKPIKFIGCLETPIETPLTAEEITAFKALRTNHPNTTILNDAGAWMSVKYNADTKTYIDEPKVLKLVDSSTGVVYELKIVDGNLTVNPV